MSELTDLLWEKAEPILFISKDQYLATLAEWTIKPVYLDGELAWITVQKGPEFHFQSVGPTRRMPLRMIREFLQGILDEHGYVLTKTPVDDERQQRFNRRFGFVEIDRDALDVHFRLDRLPHA